jgi:hypothetical protein
VKTQIRIINACCILHNFIRDEMEEDDLLREVDHNFIRDEMEENDLLREVDRELEKASINENEALEENITC